MKLLVQNHSLYLPNGNKYKCATGRGGIGLKKEEGDGITPIGTWPMRCVYYRPDRVKALETNLPALSLEQDDIWIDAPDHPDYNTKAKLPFKDSHEALWRDDHVYDLIIPLGFNDDPPVQGKGSAIFMHIARTGYSATEGCVALSRDDLLEILKHCSLETQIEIKE